MKLLVVINSLSVGGAEMLIAESLPMFLEANIHVEVALLNGKSSPLLKKVEQYPNIKIHKLTKKSLYNPNIVFKLSSLITNFDIVHIHLFPALYWGALAKTFRRKKKKPLLIYTEHNTHNRRRNRVFRCIDRLIYRRYSKIVVISDLVKYNLKKHLGFPNSCYQLIANGVNLSRFNKSNVYQFDQFDQKNFNIIGMVASFTEQKDQETLIRAVARLDDSYRLALVGDGPKLKDCETLTRELSLEKRVYFLGIQSDVPGILKSCNIVVLSSNFEGMSLSALEAMASGRPFLASDVPGLKDLVGGYGELFDHKNEKELAKLISTVTNDELFRERIIKRCLDRAAQFSLQNYVEKHIALYSSLVNK